MAIENARAAKYLLLETVLAHKGLQLKALYTIHDVADMFNVSPRAIQQRVRRGELSSRNLPGHAKFLSTDLEDFLKNSSQRPQRPTVAS